jgi:transcriptional regulator with XRE-family HTH domain
MLRLKREELAALAGVSRETVARFETGEQMSPIIEERVTKAVFTAVAKKNPEAVNQAAQPVLEAAEKCERILSSLEPGSEAALELEKLNGKSLAELKAQAQAIADFLRRRANNFLSLTK